MNRRLLVVVPLVLLSSGCQTWGPTWSEVTGRRYNMAIEWRRPAIIERINDQGAFANDPIKVEPGMKRIVMGSIDPQPRPGGSNLEVVNMDIEPCKRYYLNAQYKNNIDIEWKPVVDWVESIAGCTVTAKK